MSKSKGGPFNFVGGLRPKRYFYNLSHFNVFDCDLGQLIPALFMETVAGDKFKISNTIVVRTQPLFSPILQDIKVFTEYFFVPYRILWEDFESFLTGGKDGNFSATVPLWNNIDETSSTADRIFLKGSLADKFALPCGSEIPFVDFPTFFFQAAYNRIFNEYYRDETIDDEVSDFNNVILRRRWKKDYFTSALPFQQRGNAAGFALKLTQNGDYITDECYDGNLTVDGFTQLTSAEKGLYGDNHGVFTGPLYDSTWLPSIDKKNVSTGFNIISGSDQGTYVYQHKGRYIPGSLSVGFEGADNNFLDISSLRLAFQIQKFLERNARAGYRFNEFLLAHYAVAPRDSVLQRPEYIGGSRSSLMVSEVLQTSATEEGSPQGSLAGRGLSATGDYIATYTCSEPGVIIGLFSCMPSNLYDSQGIHKMFTRKSRYDFYFPEFSHLSEQPIKKREIFVSSDSIENDKTFGFQPIYQEYRHRRNYVTGEFRPSLNGVYKEYTFARYFSTAPTLSSSFLESNPDSSRVFAINSLNPLLVNFGNIIKSLRPITKFSDPGLIDHF